MSVFSGLLPVLAQSSSMTTVKMVIALAVVLAVTGVLLALLSIVRRRMHHESGVFVPRDFTLSDLRSLHREGKLTDDEFERAKARLVDGVQAKLLKEAKPSMNAKPFQEELKDA